MLSTSTITITINYIELRVTVYAWPWWSESNSWVAGARLCQSMPFSARPAPRVESPKEDAASVYEEALAQLLAQKEVRELDGHMISI